MSLYAHHDRQIVYTEIDQQQCRRVVPMKMLVLGFVRR
jgi:hypothetical protein